MRDEREHQLFHGSRTKIAGVVSGIGPKVTRYKMGDRVAVGNFVDSWRKCHPCLQGLDSIVSKERLGLTMVSKETEKHRTQGGYSNKIVVDENYVLRIPTTFLWMAEHPFLRRYHTLFASYALESRSWKKSGHYRARRV